MYIKNMDYKNLSKKEKDLISAKISFVVYELLNSDYSYQNGRAADHFNKIRTRLLEGKKLTKKMKENLGWILNNIKEIK